MTPEMVRKKLDEMQEDLKNIKKAKKEMEMVIDNKVEPSSICSSSALEIEESL